MNDNKEPVFLQALMDRAYFRWRNNKDAAGQVSGYPLSPWAKHPYRTFVNSLGGLEKKAVLVGNLNYQIENGGFHQWCENEYVVCADDLVVGVLDVIANSCVNEKAKKVVNEISDMVSKVHRIWKEVDHRVDDFLNHPDYDELDRLDTRFYEINKQFLSICEAYLVKRFVEGDL
jgi:hypothetical protein